MCDFPSQREAGTLRKRYFRQALGWVLHFDFLTHLTRIVYFYYLGAMQLLIFTESTLHVLQHATNI